MTTLSWRLPILFSFLAIHLASVAATNSYSVVERGLNHAVWSKITRQTNSNGAITYRTNTFTELAGGLNRIQNGQWVKSNPRIIATTNGAAGVGAPHSVLFADNINTRGSVRIQTPEGQWLKSHVLGLAYHDATSGSNVWIAETKNSTGQIVGDSQVIYTNAFSGVKADVRYRYRKAGLEQDIILRARPPKPEVFGLNPTNTYLWTVTEFVDTSAPQIEQNPLSSMPEGDQTISFGSLRTAEGRAFALTGQTNRWRGALVSKSWETWQGRKLLVERVRLRQIQKGLQKLPKVGGTNDLSAAISREAKWFATGTLPVGEKLAVSEPRSMKELASLNDQSGYVLDYYFAYSTDEWSFLCGTTTVISDEVHLSNYGYFDPGAIIKFDEGASLYIDGGFWWDGLGPCGGYSTAILTSIDDDSFGETIPGSSGTPDGCMYGPALVVQGVDFSTAQSAVTVMYGCPGVTTPTPEVTIAAIDRVATKGTSDVGTFRVTREEGDWSSSMTVYFAVSGTANTTSDYYSIGTSAVIPADLGSVDVTVTPRSAGGTVYDSTVVATLQADGAYEIGSSAAAKVTVYDPSVPAPLGIALPSDCVVWWRGENNANDSKGTVHGTMLNSGGYTYGKVGQGFDFDGENDHVRVTDNSALDFTTAMTIEAWIYPTGTGRNDAIVVKWGASGSNQRSYSFSRGPDDIVYLAVTSNGYDATVHAVYSVGAVLKDQWTHLAGTYDGSTLRLYVNGVAQGSGVAHSGGIFAGTDDLAIGGVAGDTSVGTAISLFQGSIDEVTMYNRALSATEIQNIYNAGRGGKFIDSDSDGLPDAWEQTYFSGLGSGPTGDYDSDGLTNLQEYQGGTNPTVANAPVIQTQPQSKDVCQGSSATFTVVPTGAAAASYSYQWKLNGGNISGATSSSFTRSSVGIADVGTYTVVVSSAGNSTSSAGAALTMRLCDAIEFEGFADYSLLQFNADAAPVTTTLDGPVLQLTPALDSKVGTVFLKSLMSLRTNASFSTHFAFRLSQAGGETDHDGVKGADGVTFTLQNIGNTAVGASGGGIGYIGISNSVTIEFDTWYNPYVPPCVDPELPDGGTNGYSTNFPYGDGNHVAVVFNGGTTDAGHKHIATPMNNSNVWYVWIDYNGSTSNLEVRLSQLSVRPVDAVLTNHFRALDYLTSSNVYVGFTSATGGSHNQQDILWWEMKPYCDPFGPTNNHPPTLTTISTRPGGSKNTAYPISYASLLAASDAYDADGDIILFRITELTSGILKDQNGQIVTGTTTSIDPGETFSWTPPFGQVGSALNAFKVVARDVNGAESSPAVQVKVEVSDGNIAPVVNAGVDVSLPAPAPTVSVSLSQGLPTGVNPVSDDGKVDSSPEIRWSRVSGPAEVSFTTPDSTGHTTATFDTPGDYVLMLTAHDGQLESSDTVNVSVCGQDNDVPLDVVVMLDISQSMDGVNLVNAKAAVRQLVSKLRFSEGTGSDALALLPFTYTPEWGTLPFSTDPNEILTYLDALDVQSRSFMQSPFSWASSKLKEHAKDRNARPVIVIISDFKMFDDLNGLMNSSSPAFFAQDVAAAKAEGIRIVGVGFNLYDHYSGDHPDYQGLTLMNALASSPEDAHEATSTSEFSAILDRFKRVDCSDMNSFAAFAYGPLQKALSSGAATFSLTGKIVDLRTSWAGKPTPAVLWEVADNPGAATVGFDHTDSLTPIVSVTGGTADATITFRLTATTGNETDGYTIRKSETTVTLVAALQNHAPEVIPDVFRLKEDSVNNLLYVLRNDSDPDADDLVITAVSQPQHGVATIVNDGKAIKYTPDLNYCTTYSEWTPENPSIHIWPDGDYFQYTVTDQPSVGTAQEVTMPILVKVTPEDDPASATDDLLVVSRTGLSGLNVLANDLNIDRDEVLDTSIYPPPLNGYTISGVSTITREGGGDPGSFDSFTPGVTTLAYQPDPLATADYTVHFWYTNQDTHGNKAFAQVTLIVTTDSANHAPDAKDDYETTWQDTIPSFKVMDNDRSPGGWSISLTEITTVSVPSGESTDWRDYFDHDGSDVPQYPLVFHPKKLSGTGSATIGEYVFRYTVLDDHPYFPMEAEANLTVLVAGIGPAPVARDDKDNVVEFGGSHSVDINVLDNDSGDGKQIHPTAGIVTSPAHGTVVRITDSEDPHYGWLRYTPASAVSPAPAYTGWDSFTYQILDAHGRVAVGRVEVGVYNAESTHELTAHFERDAITEGALDVLGRSGGDQTKIVRDGFLNLSGVAYDDDWEEDASYYEVNLYTAAFELVTSFTSRTMVDSSRLLATFDMRSFPDGVYFAELIIHGGVDYDDDVLQITLQSDHKIGNLKFSETDFTANFGGAPINIVRSYDSINGNFGKGGDYGPGWTFGLTDLQVEFDETRNTVQGLWDEWYSRRSGGGRNVSMTMPNGKKATFRFKLSPETMGTFSSPNVNHKAEWVSPPGVAAVLSAPDQELFTQPFDSEDPEAPLLNFWSGNPGTLADYYDIPNYELTFQDKTVFHIQREPEGFHEYADEDTTPSNWAVETYGKARLTQIDLPTGAHYYFVDGRVDYQAPGETRKPVLLAVHEAAHGLISAIHDHTSLDEYGAPIAGKDPVVLYEYEPVTDNLPRLVAVRRLREKAADGKNAAYETTRYEYKNPDRPYLITSIIDPRGVKVANTLYDDQGRMIKVEKPDGRWVEYNHDDPVTATALGAVARERIVDSEGLTTIHETDGHGNVVLTVNPLGEKTERVFDEKDAVTSEIVKDTEGVVVAKTLTSLKYSSEGIVERKLVASGLDDATATRSYEERNDLNQVTRVIGPQYASTITATDIAGSSAIPAKALETMFAYNETTGQPTGLKVSRSGVEGETLSEATYYSDGQLHEKSDASGTKMIYAYYDGVTDISKGQFGDVKTITAKDAANNELTKTEYEYDAHSQRTKEIRKKRVSGVWTAYATTEYKYDDAGRVIETIDADGGRSYAVYDSGGKASSSKDRYGAETKYSYDANGDLIETEYADGTISRAATYYARADQLSPYLKRTIRQDRHFPADSVNGDVTLYDALGRVVASDRVKDVVIDLVEDGPVKKAICRGRSEVSPLLRLNSSGGSTEGGDHDSSTVYDAAGRVDKTLDAYQRATNYSYDKNGRRWKSWIDYRFTLTGHNADGSVAWTLDPSQFTELQTTGYDVVRGGVTVGDYLYNMTAEEAADVLTTHEANRLTRFTYDEFGRLTRTDLPYETGTSAVYTETKYDAAGQRWMETDADGKATAYVYDGAGRLSWVVTDVESSLTALSTTATTAANWEAWAKGSRSASDSTATHYLYDDLGQLKEQVDANGHSTLFEYDVMGRRTKRTLPDTTYEEWVYDYTSPTPGSGVAKVNKVRHRDFAGRFILTTSDINGRVTSRQPDGQETGVTSLPTEAKRGVAFTYTATGQRAKMTDGSSSNERNTYYAYDGFGRLRVKQQPEGTLYYGYEKMGKVEEISARREYPSYSDTNWNVFDAESLGEADASTARLDGAHMLYDYDVLGRLDHVNNGPFGIYGNEVADYGYDYSGNLKSVNYGNGLISQYEYDYRNHLRYLRSYTQVGYVQTTQTTFDYDEYETTGTGLTWTSRRLKPSGLRQGLAELIAFNGHTYQRAVAYDNDGLNRLKAERVRGGLDAWPSFAATTVPTTPASGDVLYDVGTGYSDSTGYDKVGNRRSRTASSVANVNTRTYATYDANDRLGSTLATGTTAATYDANGSTLQFNFGGGSSWQESTADSYDFENRLISATRGGNTITFVYDGDGNRVSKMVNSTSTRYLVDDRNPTGYAQVLEEQDASGNPLVTYVYGLDLISQTRNTGTVSSPTWERHFFGYDGQGSVRYLTDDDAVVTDTYTYDAFGIQIDDHHLGSSATENHYRYAGEQWDQDLGMHYLRARYYQPEMGRFWTMDTYEGTQEDPLSLHKYLYCSGNAVNSIDPSGHFGLADTGMAASLGNALESMYNTGVTTVGNALQATIFGVQAKKTAESIIVDYLIDEAVTLGVGVLAGKVLGFAGEVWETGRVKFHIGGGPLISKLTSCRTINRNLFNNIGRDDVCAASVAAALRSMKTGEACNVSLIEANLRAYRRGVKDLQSMGEAAKYIEEGIGNGVKIQNMGATTWRDVKSEGVYVVGLGSREAGGGHVVIGIFEGGKKEIYDPLMGVFADFKYLKDAYGGELGLFAVTGL